MIILIACFAINVSAQLQTFSIQVSQSSDDAEESEDKLDILTESSDLELVFDDFSDQNNQTVGIRFTEVLIPINAIIETAYIQFHADDTGDIQTDLTIKGESTANSQTFIDSPGNISSRNTTMATVEWLNVPEWTTSHQAGINERTPDLSTLIVEMITNNDWEYGNPLSFIVTGTGSREAESFDGTPEEAPILVVQYTVPQSDFDLGIVNVVGIDPYMYSQSDVSISSTVKNHGLNPIDSFELSYSVNNVLQTTETINQSIAPGDSYNLSFSETLDLSNIGLYTLDVNVATEMDGVNFNNTLTTDIEIIPDYSNVYFEYSSVWKYLDDGSDLGMEWIMTSFDDSDWTLGSNEFGFGDGDESILLEQGNITYNFRKQVEIQDINLISKVIANIACDDALVIYVNGQEVSRSFNLPTGSITASTTPDRDVPHDFENLPVAFDIPVSYFNTGINSIAVEVHNLSANDQDLSFKCEIIDEAINYIVDGPYVIYEGDDILIKNITIDGPQIDTFPAGSDPTLTCDLPNGNSFSFNLIGNHEIPDSEYEMPDKFLVTTDIEGQFDAYTFQLQSAGVIDENYNWIYGEGHLFFLGDMFDRGQYVTQCLWLLYKLEQEAKQAGGEVHFIVGNHEVLNFEHDFRYVRDNYFENAHHLGEMLYDLYDNTTELGRWLRSKNILENAGKSAIMVHAGLSPQVKNLNLTYDQINDFGRLGMDDNCPSGNTACQIVNGGSDEGVYWYRGIADEELSQVQVDDIVSSFDGETMIFGHTVFPQVTPLYDQKVIVVDVDHGDNFDAGYMEALYFENGCYHRQVTNFSGVNLTLINADCTSVNTSEIHAKEELIIKPNLFTEDLTVQIPSSTTERYVMVHNLFGHLIATLKMQPGQNESTFNTTSWNQGTYIITAHIGNQLSSKKAIKL